MTKDERHEYMKKWRAENREKIKSQQRENARRKALADLASVRQLDGGVCVMCAMDGRRYVVGGRNK